MAEIIYHVNDDWASANPVDIKKYVETELAIRIENALKQGVENAIKMRELKIKVGTNNERKIRLTIKAMCLSKKCIILSSGDGYWIAKNPQEVIEWQRYMMSYVKDISHIVKIVGEATTSQFGEKGFQTKFFN